MLPHQPFFSVCQEQSVTIEDIEGEVIGMSVERQHFLLGERVSGIEQRPGDGFHERLTF